MYCDEPTDAGKLVCFLSSDVRTSNLIMEKQSLPYLTFLTEKILQLRSVDAF